MQVAHENTKRTKISKAISCMSKSEAFLRNKDSLSIEKIALQHPNVKICQYVLFFYILSVTHTGCRLRTEGGTGGLGKSGSKAGLK